MRGHAVNIPSWEHQPEDAHLLRVDLGVAAVFDGLAGHGHGNVASAVAVRALAAELSHGTSTSREAGWAGRTLQACRQELVAARRADPEHRQMTSTAVIARLSETGLDLAWCGDSRAYEVTGDGRLVALTYDHDFIYESLMAGRIGRLKAEHARLAVAQAQTPSEAYHAGGPAAKKAFKRRHMMCSELSAGDVGTARRPFATGSVLVLCSDGVHDNLTLSGMRELAAGHAGHPRELAEALASEASRRAHAGEGSAHVDDITCVTLAV